MLQVGAYGGAVADITGIHELGPGDGRVLIKTGREGLAARAGHDLTLEITRWSARLTVPGTDDLAAATVTAELDLGSLTVREGSGGAKPLTDRDRRDIEAQARKILGEPRQATFTSAKVIPLARYLRQPSQYALPLASRERGNHKPEGDDK